MNQTQAIILYNQMSNRCRDGMILASGIDVPRTLDPRSSEDEFLKVGEFLLEFSVALTDGALQPVEVHGAPCEPLIDAVEVQPDPLKAEGKRKLEVQHLLFPEACSHEESQKMKASDLGLDNHWTNEEVRRGKLISKTVKRPRPEMLTPYEVGHLIGVSKDSICRAVHRRLISWIFIRGTRRRWLPISELYRAAEAKKRGQIRGRKPKKEATE